MDEKKIERLLDEHGIRPTANRIVIARALALMDYPVSMKELETRVQTIDKSNVFRTLSLFKEHHLVHQLEDGNDVVRYELCLSHDSEEDDDMHVHFYCERCQRTFCLSDTPVPQVDLPSGYEKMAVNYMVKGLCPACSRRRILHE
ncbi:MAG: transcriptional repressor [Prevotella sp.]|nr:transcriptional repressor [Prevotella sp.]